MILREERRGTDFTVPPEGVRLGRDPALEITFPEDDDVVSGLHCRVVKRDDGDWWLEDLGSTNGTWLGGERLSEPARLTTGMRFSLGQRGPVLRVTIPGQFARTQQEPAVKMAEGEYVVRLRRVKGGEDLVASGREIVLGRSAGCEVALRTVADTVVSKRHAKISFVDGGTVMLADLGSRNGTYLNGTMVQERARLRPGDRVMLGWQGPLFEIRTLGAAAMPDAEGAPYEPQREPRRSLSGMVAVAEVEAKVEGHRVRAALFLKSLARQIATVSSTQFRLVLSLGFLGLMGAVYFVWSQSVRQNQVAERNLRDAQQAFSQQLRRADSAQQLSNQQLELMRQELDSARRSAVSRSVLDSLEARVREAERRAAAPPPQSAPMTAPASPHDFTDVARENGRAVGLVIVRFANDSIMGSGFTITPSGYFVTNRHVVQEEGHGPARQILVVMAETNDALTADVAMVSTAQNQDVAVLKIRAYHGPTVRSVDWQGRGAQQGAQAAMIGFPFGTQLAVDQGGYIHSTLFGGYIAQTGEWIRFAGNTYAGVSGSPVFNAEGQVIAVHFGAPREGLGLGISVPMSKVRRWLPPEAKTELGL